MKYSSARLALAAAIAAAGALSCQKAETEMPPTPGGTTFTPTVTGVTSDIFANETKAIGQAAGQTIYMTEMRIPFGDDLNTKSAPVTAVHPSFGCSGYMYPLFDEWQGTETPDLFHDKTVTKNGGSWTFSDGDCNWPGASYAVRIYGWSPATADGLSLVSGGTDLPLVIR